MIRVEAAEHVLAAIRQLPDQQRQVLTLHDLEELDTSEVAAALQLTEGAARVRLHRARKALREMLEQSRLELVGRT